MMATYSVRYLDPPSTTQLKKIGPPLTKLSVSAHAFPIRHVSLLSCLQNMFLEAYRVLLQTIWA